MNRAKVSPAPVTRTIDGPREARVIACLGSRGARVEVDGAILDATVATTGAYRPEPGDRVVVLPSAHGAWILGVIGAIREAAATSDGVEAAVEDDVLTVRSPAGELLFQHDARTGKSEVRARQVEIRAEDIALAGKRVNIQAEDELRLERGDDQLRFDEAGAQLSAKRLRASLTEARFAIKEVVFGAERVESAVKRARQVVEVAELRAGRLVQRARDVFRETEGVEQVRAERVRIVAKTAFQVLAERATVKAENDLDLMGERINLG